MTITNANFINAIQILRNRYENQRIAISNYTNLILRAKRFNNGVASDIIAFHDAINECILGLTSLGYNVASWDPLLVAITTNKNVNKTIKLYLHIKKNF